MNEPKSALASLFGFVKNVAAIALLGWIGWYAYSQLRPVSSSASDSEPGTEYNCRKAFATRESDYACMESSSCTMTTGEMAELKRLEAEIDEHCALPFDPLAGTVP